MDSGEVSPRPRRSSETRSWTSCSCRSPGRAGGSARWGSTSDGSCARIRPRSHVDGSRTPSCFDRPWPAPFAPASCGSRPALGSIRAASSSWRSTGRGRPRRCISVWAEPSAGATSTSSRTCSRDHPAASCWALTSTRSRESRVRSGSLRSRRTAGLQRVKVWPRRSRPTSPPPGSTTSSRVRRYADPSLDRRGAVSDHLMVVAELGWG